MSLSTRKHRTETPPAHRAPSWPGRPDADAPISFADIKRLPDPDWIGRSQQGAFALDPELLEPLELTDWSYWLDRQFGTTHGQNAVPGSIEARFRNLATDVSFELYRIAKDIALPSLSIGDFMAELDDDRSALYADVNAERVLIDELAPLTAKAGA